MFGSDAPIAVALMRRLCRRSPPRAETMATFLLQANPDLYHLDAALRLHTEPITWSLNQHATKVTAGDTVYLWRASGRAKRVAGIVARATVGRRLSQDEPNTDDAFYAGAYEPGSAPRVALRDVEVIPVGHAVTREALRAEPATSELTILRAPNQTVFPVPEDAAERRRAHAYRTDRARRPRAAPAAELAAELTPTRRRNERRCSAGRVLPMELCGRIASADTCPTRVIPSTAGEGEATVYMGCPTGVARAALHNHRLTIKAPGVPRPREPTRR